MLRKLTWSIFSGSCVFVVRLHRLLPDHLIGIAVQLELEAIRAVRDVMTMKNPIRAMVGYELAVTSLEGPMRISALVKAS